MNYLITGGTGLIGKILTEKLLLNDNNVAILTRNKNKAELIFKPDNKLTFSENISLEDIEQTDVVINLAGEPIADKRWSSAQKNKICQSRWQLTEEITKLINQAKVPPHLFISGSAIGIYGRQDSTLIDEDFKGFNDEFTHTVCKKWEEIALSSDSINTRVALLRTGIVLSKDGGALSKMLLPFKLGVGGRIASGEQMMSWIHINDMVNAIIHIINSDLKGEINMTSPSAVSNKEFSSNLANSLHRPCLLTTPSSLLNVLFGEMADLLLFGQNVYPKKLIDSGFTFEYPYLVAALNQIIEQKD